MYLNNAFYLSTSVVRDETTRDGSFGFQSLATRKVRNGLVVKNARGNSMIVSTREQDADMHLILSYDQEIFGKSISCVTRVSDEFALRIVTYIRDYFGRYYTNCSTFSEYMRTGVFTEMDVKKSGFMFTGGMNAFVDQRIRPGDSLCVFYYSKWASSRKYHGELRRSYRRCCKNAERSLEDLMVLKRCISADELLYFYRLGVFIDYHFMYCIGINNGQPVFIQQMGRNDPKVNLVPSPIVVSVGNVDISHHDVLACAFVKRGR